MQAQGLVQQLLDAGADDATVRVAEHHMHELEVEWSELSMLRTTHAREATLTALVGGRKGVTSCNLADPEDVAQSIEKTVDLARGSRPDPAHTLADGSEPRTFEAGAAEPDLDAMHDRLEELLAWRQQAFPRVRTQGLAVTFDQRRLHHANSRGVDLQSRTSSYGFGCMFVAADGKRVSSLNGLGGRAPALDRPLSELMPLERLFGQAESMIDTAPVPHKFVGDLIITPEALNELLRYALGFLGDHAMIRGTSVYQEALGQAIATEALTLRARSREGMAEPCFITHDGFVAEDDTIIRDGVLQGYLLSLYGANKTGRDRARTAAAGFEIEPGDRPLQEMVRGVKEGVLLARFSGGYPADNGDFAGVAKNSFYIRDGKVQHALSETMVSGNLVRMLEQIVGISRERISDGASLFPWLHVEGITIS